MATLMLHRDHLLLRELTVADWLAVHGYSARPEVARYQPWGPNTLEESHALVEQAVAAVHAVPRTWYQPAVTPADSGQLIGTAGLTVYSAERGQGNVGYFLHPDAWGHGCATEAARLLNYGFTDLGLHRIAATCDPRNTASVRVLEKLGMTCEGRLRHTMRLRDGRRDSLVFSILVHEWQQAHSPAAPS